MRPRQVHHIGGRPHHQEIEAVYMHKSAHSIKTRFIVAISCHSDVPLWFCGYYSAVGVGVYPTVTVFSPVATTCSASVTSFALLTCAALMSCRITWSAPAIG